LQKSVTEFLTIVSQIARGDLTCAAREHDALGTWWIRSTTCSITCQGAGARGKAAIDVQSSANEIYRSEEMSTGAIQQDQEITNTSSAVEQLTVSMSRCPTTPRPALKLRVAPGRRRAGQRSVRDTLEGMQHTLFRASHSQAHQGAGRSFAGISEIVNVITILRADQPAALNAELKLRAR